MKKILLYFGLIILCNAFCFAQNNKGGELKTGYIEIGKAKIYYEEKGTGTPLIMIHAGFLDRSTWDKQFEYFSKDYRVIRYDVRNYGLSRSDSDSYSDYGDLNLIMEKLGIDKAIIMGLSMGGYIAIDFTLSYPDKVIALIPVSSGMSGYIPTDKEWLECMQNLNKAYEENDFMQASEVFLRYWFDGPKRTKEQVDKNLREKLKNILYSDIKNFKPEVRPQKLNPPAINRLSEIRVPVLTIYGDIDMQGIIDLANKIEKEISGVKKCEIKNAAHMVNMEFPNEFNEILGNFLEALKYNITTAQAEKMILENSGNSDFVLLDVRKPEELETGYIKGAINIDIKANDFLEKLDGLNKDKIYLVYCRSGGRSAKAMEEMRKKGFSRVYNLLGGIKKWKEENRSIENK